MRAIRTRKTVSIVVTEPITTFSTMLSDVWFPAVLRANDAQIRREVFSRLEGALRWHFMRTG